jgi:transcriptional regulator
VSTDPFEEPPQWEPRRSLPLERGWVRQRLIRELAEGLKTQEQLAEEYGTTRVSISKFKQRHMTAIEQQKTDFEDEFRSLWIAQKALRLAELQADIEELDEQFELDGAAFHEDKKAALDAKKVKHNALLQAAKELGQIPSAAGVTVETKRVTFTIPGVDLEQLR